ncbi:MAG: acyltransferase [Phycisphaerae bacterium]
MGARSFLGPGTEVHITQSVTIGDDVMISWGCSLLDTDNHSLWFSERCNDVLIAGRRAGLTLDDKDWSVVRCAPIVVQNKVWIGMHSIILPGVTLGEGSVVGAGSVVTKDTAPWTVVAGNPARVIRTLSGRGRADAEQVTKGAIPATGVAAPA